MMKTKSSLKVLRTFVVLVMSMMFFHTSHAQSLEQENKKVVKETNKLLREAEEELGEDDFASAEASYRKAVSKNTESVTARYNMANMYYSKEKPAQAEARLKQAAELAETKEDKHRIFHNMGNTYMEQKNYKAAVEAYKNALRNNPNDEETRYNFALAKKMLEKEEQEGGGGEDKEQEQKDQKKEEQKGDKGDKEQDKQDGEEKKDQGGDQQKDQQQEPEKQDEKGEPKDKKEQEGQEGEPQQQQQQQPVPGQLSPQQVKSLLEAMNNEEKKVQDKINAQKVKGAKVRTEKDW